MSVRMLSAAWDADLPPMEKLVLLALADCANDQGHCWPAVSTLMRKSGQGERTVRRCVQSLITKGHLSQRQRVGTSPVYGVHPCQSGTPAAKAPLPERQPPLPERPETPARAAPKPLKNLQEPSKEDSASDDAPSLRPEHVFEFYQELAAAIGRPVPRDFTPERRQLTKGRISQFGLADFETVFAKCRESPFLRGDRGRSPLTFDWLMQKKNFIKVLEGNYDS